MGLRKLRENDMKRILVGYKSISGFTKTYADWIAQTLGADLLSAKQITPKLLRTYDIIIYGGSLHASGIAGLKCLPLDKLADKTIIVFCTGASPKTGALVELLRKENLPVQSQIPLFYMRGGFDFSKLDFWNKILMRLFKLKLRMMRKKTSDATGMLAAYEKPLNAVKKQNIDELVSYVQSICN